MANLLYVGLIAEGVTDYKFFIPIIEKTLIECAYDCTGDVDINVVEINCSKGESFRDYVKNGQTLGEEYGLPILIVHSDSDSPSPKNVLENKFEEVLKKDESNVSETLCKYIIPLIPIQETESWMLADKNLFKKILGTNKSDAELNLSGHPETFTDPKSRIENAIRIGRSSFPKKLRNQVKISDLYSPIGQSLQLDKLDRYESFKSFKSEILVVMNKLNLIH